MKLSPYFEQNDVFPLHLSQVLTASSLQTKHDILKSSIFWAKENLIPMADCQFGSERAKLYEFRRSVYSCNIYYHLSFVCIIDAYAHTKSFNHCICIS